MRIFLFPFCGGNLFYVLVWDRRRPGSICCVCVQSAPSGPEVWELWLFVVEESCPLCPTRPEALCSLPAGPFVSVVLSKLENMLENSLHVNLLLIGIITQLASYPQPLLRSFLLNTNMVFQPSVRSLYQVCQLRPHLCLLISWVLMSMVLLSFPLIYIYFFSKSLCSNLFALFPCPITLVVYSRQTA